MKLFSRYQVITHDPLPAAESFLAIPGLTPARHSVPRQVPPTAQTNQFAVCAVTAIWGAPEIEDKMLRSGIIQQHSFRAHVTRITSYRNFSPARPTAKRRCSVRPRRVSAGCAARLGDGLEMIASLFEGRQNASGKAVERRAPAYLLLINQIIAGKSLAPPQAGRCSRDPPNRDGGRFGDRAAAHVSGERFARPASFPRPRFGLASRRRFPEK